MKVERGLNHANELDFRNTLAKLFKCKDFILEDIRTGCTELTYIIPSEVAAKSKNVYVCLGSQECPNITTYLGRVSNMYSFDLCARNCSF